MVSKNVIITNQTGLHARPAMLFIQMAKSFKSKITVTNLKTNASADAKSMISVLGLGMVKDVEIKIEADGEDEEKAVDSLVNLIQNELKD